MESVGKTQSASRDRQSGLDTRLSRLLTRSAKGDLEAFTDLVAEVEPLVRTYLSRSGLTYAERQDALQDSFVAVFRHAGSFSPDLSALPWLFSIVINSSRKHLKQRQRQRALAELSIPTLNSAASLESTVQNRITIEFLEERARALPLIQRQVIGLTATSSLTIAEIATLLQIPEGTVKSSLFRARAELAKALLCREAGGSHE